QRQLQGSDLLRGGLPGQRYADRSVLRDGDRSCIRRNRHRGLYRVSILGYKIAGGIEVKSSSTCVGGFSVGQKHLEKSRALDRKVERVAGLAEVPLQLDDFGGGRARAQADLQSSNQRRLLRGCRAGHDEVLIDQVFELHAAAAKPCRARVGEIVGDRVEIGFL